MDNIAGSLGAAPIWRALMEKFLAGAPVEKFDIPEGIVRLTTCGNSLPNEATSSAFSEYFLKGTEPKIKCILAPQTPKPTPTNTPAPTPVESVPPSESVPAVQEIQIIIEEDVAD